VRRPRYLAPFVLAAVVTFALFRLMGVLIRVEGELDESKAASAIEFVRLRRDTEIEEKKREAPDRKPPEKEPPPPELDLSQEFRPDAGDSVFVSAFDGDAPLEGVGLAGLAAADADVVPLVRVEPQYPMRAQQRGIEGWVEVEFTISTAGTVKDPEVVAYKPSTIFNKAALQAVRRWKYHPRVVDGKPVERPGVIVRLNFLRGK